MTERKRPGRRHEYCPYCHGWYHVGHLCFRLSDRSTRYKPRFGALKECAERPNCDAYARGVK